jgi:hypothetical protein
MHPFGVRYKMEEMIDNLILLAIGALLSLWISIRVSRHFFRKQKTKIARYHHNETDDVYFIYEDGFKKKTYTKRNIKNDFEISIKESEFERDRESLERCTIP